jgi:acyl-CoA synthetase (NDP forming)/GNAT superfamily N-acetyltransferase
MPVSVASAWSSYTADVLLRDGTSVRVRALQREDKDRLQRHFHSLGPESVRFRFMGMKKDLTPGDLQRFTEMDFREHVGLAVVRGDGAEEEFIGIGRYFRDPERPSRAEFALAVSDAWQGHGAGTLLLEHLGRIAARSGIEEFEADILYGNARMLGVLEHIGVKVTKTAAAGVYHARYSLADLPHLVAASDRRAAAASAESVRALLQPRSVVLVGASRRPGTLGAALVRNLRRSFQGRLHLVNPKPGAIDGLPCHPTVADIGEPVDLGIVVVPAPQVLDAVRECAHAGARGVVVISAGFAEVSSEGRAEQDHIRDVARRYGMRMVGPNCMGILSTDPAAPLDATFAPTPALPGNVGLLSQSGALGVVILDHARALNIGVSSFFSVGNKADVSGNDLLAYWKDDPRTDVVALYLESFGNPRRFARLAPEVARKKPVVAVKSGRSAAGTRAASSHSAALACLDVAVDALFEQAGVIRTQTLEDLFDVVTLLATQPVPGGPRVAVITNAGGPGILLADACEAHGLRLPELAPETQDALRAFLPAAASPRNPVDLLASGSGEDYARAIELAGSDPGIDSVVAIYVPPMPEGAEEVAACIARGAAAVPADKPVLTVFLSSRGAPGSRATGARGRLPSYSFPENAARALAAAEGYGRWRARPVGEAQHLSDDARARVRAVDDRDRLADGEPQWLSAADVEELLDAAGIARAAFRTTSPAEAAQVAEEMGYPLVAKALVPGLVHKSDVGGVLLGLGSAEEVRAAVETLRGRMRAAGHELHEVLLQREVRGGLEALVGVVNDPTFGPLLVCGLGGVQVELLRDVSFRLPPVTDLDAREMVDRLRLRPLFDGYRGGAPADRDALVELLRRLSALVEAVPELRELDCNPVKVLPPGQGAVVVDARMRVGPVPAGSLEP